MSEEQEKNDSFIHSEKDIFCKSWITFKAASPLPIGNPALDAGSMEVEVLHNI